ncbi:purine-cytosine permease family protein [Amycolatopsis methanolica]|nr:histidine kinase [Amycolatopsis methanolica]
MEDYSLRYTPAAFRKWSPWMVFLSCLVGISAMAGYALDAAFVDAFGFASALTGFLVAAAVTLPLTLVIAFAIARGHVDIDLLTRGSGFGYLGSTLTSLVYATYTLIFLAYEGVQAWTWPWIALIGLALGTAATAPDAGHNMVHPATVSPSGLAGMTVLAVFTIAAAQLSLATQVGEQGDYLRLMPDPEPGRRGRWRLAVITGGPGFALFAVGIFFASTLLVGYASTKIGADHVGVPVDLFTAVYERLTGNHTVALVLAGVLVLLSQIKINIMNTYSGSLSWSNFFSRLLHRHPGRAVWVFLQVGLSLVLMEIDIFSHIVEVLAWYSNVGVAWIAAMVSDLVINKKWLKLAPPQLVFNRAHLYNVNPVGGGSMIVAGAVSMVAYYGAFGAGAAALSPFIALGVAVVLPPIVAAATRGRWYVAREAVLPAADELPCSVCAGNYDRDDMASCPFHGGTICSLCRSTEAACRDTCKPSAWRPPKGSVPLGMPKFAPDKELEVA